MSANIFKYNQAIAIGRLSSAPSTPVPGTLYYDAITNEVKFYDGASFESVASKAYVQSQVADAANKTLSNLTAPTSVSQDLRPATAGLQSLGADGAYWAAVHAQTIVNASDETVISVNNKELLKDGIVAVDWQNRYLTDSTDVPAVSWDNRILLDTTQEGSLNWGNRTTFAVDGSVSIDWQNRHLTNSGGLIVADWGQALLKDVGGANALDWENRSLVDASNADSILWSDRIMKDSTGLDAVNWELRQLLNNGAQLMIDFVGADVLYNADIDMDGKYIKNLPTPTSANEAATKGYVDAALEGLKPKAAVRAATTADLALLEGEITVDGVSLVSGDRVLVKDQSSTEDNGIYIVDTGSWVRASDFDSTSPIDEINGAYTFVQEGTANAGKSFVQSGSVSTVGVDPITFVFFNSAVNYTAGDGLQLIGTEFSAKLDGTSLLKAAAGLKVNSANYPDNFLPAVNITQTLGSTTRRWATYASALDANSVAINASTGTASTTNAVIRDSGLGSGIQHLIGSTLNAGEAAEYIIKIRNTTTGAIAIYKVLVACKTNAADSTLVVSYAETDVLNVTFLLTGTVGVQLRFEHSEPNPVFAVGTITKL